MPQYNIAIVLRAVDNATKVVTQVGRTVERAMGGSALKTMPHLKALMDTGSQVGGALTAMGLSAVAAGGAVTLAMKASANASREFEEAFAEVTTIINQADFGEVTDSLRRGILEMAPKVGKSAEELSRGLYEIISAGQGMRRGVVDSGEALTVLEVSAMAARSGLTTVEIAVDGITGAMNAFREQNVTASQAANVLFETVRIGKLRFDAASAALGTYGAMSAAMGVKFNEAASAIAALTTNNVDAATAATQFRSMLSQIIKPADSATAAAKEMGIEFNRQALATMGLGAWMADLRDKTGGSAEALSRLFPDIRGLNAALAMTNGAFGSLLSAIEATQGELTALDLAFLRMADTSKAAGERLAAVFNVVQIKIGETINAAAKPLINALAAVVGWLIKVGDYFKWITKPVIVVTALLGGLVLGLGVTGLALGGLVMGLTTVSTAWDAYSKALRRNTAAAVENATAQAGAGAAAAGAGAGAATGAAGQAVAGGANLVGVGLMFSKLGTITGNVIRKVFGLGKSLVMWLFTPAGLATAAVVGLGAALYHFASRGLKEAQFAFEETQRKGRNMALDLEDSGFLMEGAADRMFGAMDPTYWDHVAAALGHTTKRMKAFNEAMQSSILDEMAARSSGKTPKPVDLSGLSAEEVDARQKDILNRLQQKVDMAQSQVQLAEAKLNLAKEQGLSTSQASLELEKAREALYTRQADLAGTKDEFEGRSVNMLQLKVDRQTELVDLERESLQNAKQEREERLGSLGDQLDLIKSQLEAAREQFAVEASGSASVAQVADRRREIADLTAQAEEKIRQALAEIQTQLTTAGVTEAERLSLQQQRVDLIKEERALRQAEAADALKGLQADLELMEARQSVEEQRLRTMEAQKASKQALLQQEALIADAQLQIDKLRLKVAEKRQTVEQATNALALERLKIEQEGLRRQEQKAQASQRDQKAQEAATKARRAPDPTGGSRGGPGGSYGSTRGRGEDGLSRNGTPTLSAFRYAMNLEAATRRPKRVRGVHPRHPGDQPLPPEIYNSVGQQLSYWQQQEGATRSGAMIQVELGPETLKALDKDSRERLGKHLGLWINETRAGAKSGRGSGN